MLQVHPVAAIPAALNVAAIDRELRRALRLTKTVILIVTGPCLPVCCDLEDSVGL